MEGIIFYSFIHTSLVFVDMLKISDGILKLNFLVLLSLNNKIKENVLSILREHFCECEFWIHLPFNSQNAISVFP